MRAFSLIEIMVAVVIVGVVAALAVPSVTSLVAMAKARATAQRVAALVEQARSRAAAEGRCFRLSVPGGAATGHGLQIERRNSVDCVNISSDGWDAPVHAEPFPEATLTLSCTLATGTPNEIIFRPSSRLRGDGSLPVDAAHQGYGARILAAMANGRFAVVDITAQGRICTRVSNSTPPALAAPVKCP